MNFPKIKTTLLVLMCLFMLKLNAQDRVLEGLITTFDSIAVMGARVQVKSTKQTTLSDSLGRFTIRVNAKDKIKIGAKGFVTRTVRLEDKTKLLAVNLKLKAGAKAREYAVGYGHVSDADKLNAVAQLSRKDVDFSQYSNMYDLIRGRFAGVAVHSNGDIVIRGVNSLNLSSAALIVVDGVPSDQSVLNSISPANVASINVIKDGSAAIYGSRGANGVIIIETRKGGIDED